MSIGAIREFKRDVAEAIRVNTLDEANWGSEDWKTLGDKVDQEILQDAFNQHSTVTDILAPVGVFEARSCKQMARIETKKEQQWPGRENYFKVVSDFIALYLPCKVQEISGKIDAIRRIVLDQNGPMMHIRGSSPERPYGSHMEDSQYKDIVQFVYIFLERVGYPVEIQIGHEFASHTFTIDSARRDDENCDKVSLWDNDFYQTVRQYILDKANGEDVMPKDEIEALCQEIHDNNVPKDLQDILDRI